jgi:type IV pilus assembly protein PilA
MLQSDFQRAADGAKTAVAEFYANSGHWPAKNEDAGLPTPDTYRGESLRRLDVNGPVITLTFDARSGIDGGKIVLAGEATPNFAMGINWTCASPNIIDIATIFPTCEYRQP